MRSSSAIRAGFGALTLAAITLASFSSTRAQVLSASTVGNGSSQVVSLPYPLPTPGATTAPVPLPSGTPPGNDAAAPQFRQAPAIFAAAAATGAAQTCLASPPTGGDLLLAEVTYDLAGDLGRGVVPQSGWAVLDAPVFMGYDNFPTLTTFYHIAASGESGCYLFYQSAPTGVIHPMSAILMDIYNQDPFVPFNGHTSNTNYNPYFYLPYAVKPTIAHTLALGFFGADGGSLVQYESVSPGQATYSWFVNAFANATARASLAVYAQNQAVGQTPYTTVSVPQNQPYVAGLDIVNPILPTAAPSSTPAPPGVGPTPNAAGQFYDNFANETVGTLPTGYMGVTYPNASPAPFAVLAGPNGQNVMGEPSTGGAQDILYWNVATTMSSISESYSFVYTGPASVIDPFLVMSPATSPLQGYRVYMSPSAPHNSGAGQLIHQYMSGGVQQNQSLSPSRLSTEPYVYQVGHTYRVDLVADPATEVLSAREYDVALGPGHFDQTHLVLTGSISVYPGVMNRLGGAIAFNDFSFAPSGNLPVRPQIARRAYDFTNTLGFNYSYSGNVNDLDPQSALLYFPQLLISHVRVSADVSGNAATQLALEQAAANSLIPNFEIDADCLTSNATTLAYLNNTWIPSITSGSVGGCATLEMANEPNNYNTDPNYTTDLVKQANLFRSAFPSLSIWGPSILPNAQGYPSVEQTMEPIAFPTASPTPIPIIATNISAWNDHPYTGGFQPENDGYGGFFGNACGSTMQEDCGVYGALNWNDNESKVLAPGLPGVSTEGEASFGSYPSICGHNNVDLASQQVYLQRGFLFGFVTGHLQVDSYKLFDDGGCSDGFGTYGALSRLQNNDLTTQQISPKPAYTALVYFMHLLYDFGAGSSTFTPQPLSFSVGGQTAGGEAPPDVEQVVLAESDGSYRIVLWSDSPIWNVNANGNGPGAEYPIVSDPVQVNLGSTTSTMTVYQQTLGTGQWTASTPTSGGSLNVTVSQAPLIIDVIPAGFSATPAPLPTNVPTPGPVETNAPRAPSPLPTNQTALYTDKFDSDTVGTIPAGFSTNAQAAPWAVGTLTPNSSTNSFGESNGGSTTDYAWASGTYSPGLEFQFDYHVPSSGNAPMTAFINTATAPNYFFIDLQSGILTYHYYGNFFGEGTVGGYKTSPTIGHTYGVKVLVTPAIGVPAAPTITVATTGGTLPAASNVNYRIAAVDSFGNVSKPGPEAMVPAVDTGSTSVNTVNWPAIANAATYKVYGRTASGELFMATTSSTTYTDSGSVTPAGALPGGYNGDTFQLKEWDLTGTEPAYGSAITAQHGSGSLAGGARSKSTGAWEIDDFSNLSNPGLGTTLPTLTQGS